MEASLESGVKRLVVPNSTAPASPKAAAPAEGVKLDTTQPRRQRQVLPRPCLPAALQHIFKGLRVWQAARYPANGCDKVLPGFQVVEFYKAWDRFGTLSNFSPHPIEMPETLPNGEQLSQSDLPRRTWQTLEHYYQAQKFAGEHLSSHCLAGANGRGRLTSQVVTGVIFERCRALSCKCMLTGI